MNDPFITIKGNWQDLLALFTYLAIASFIAWKVVTTKPQSKK